MVCFPNAKINIGLQVCSKRADGFHNIQTIFYPIGLSDALECVIDESRKNTVDIHTSGKDIEGKTEDNLCFKAYHLLQQKTGDLPGLIIHLLKKIPMGAGMGGGSSNGAFMLKMMNELFELNMPNTELADISLELGSDCPFFIQNSTCYATGRGEILQPIDLDLSKQYKIIIVNPGIHVNTGWAFSQLTLKHEFCDLREAICEPIEQWKHHITNDFEAAISANFPALAIIKQQLYDAGALYVSMSGRGSTFYGIFEKSAAPELEFPENYYCKWV